MTLRMLLSAGKIRLAIVFLGFFVTAPLARGDETVPIDAPEPEFKPGDIAIGEPIPLPFAAPRAEVAPPTPAAAPVEATEPRSLLSDPKVSAANPPPQSRGTGWIGLQVAESTEPGRWAISEVAAGGPAATAGIMIGDEVRAIDGTVLQSADHVAQALTALAAGQRVSLAMARGGQPLEITVVAVERPVALSSRTWQGSPEPDARAIVPPAASAFGAAPSTLPPSPTLSSSPNLPSAPAFASPAPEASRPRQTSPSAAAVPRADTLPLPSPASSPSGRTALGVRTVPIDPELQSRFKLSDGSGAYVIGVVQDLPASKAGVPPGSVIVAIDNRPVRSPDELTRLVTAGPVGRPVPLEYVLPGGASHRAEVVLQSLDRPLEAALVGQEPLSPTQAPELQSYPPARTSRRPETTVDSPSVLTMERDVIQGEMRDLRSRLERLEKRFDALSR